MIKTKKISTMLENRDNRTSPKKIRNIFGFPSHPITNGSDNYFRPPWELMIPYRFCVVEIQEFMKSLKRDFFSTKNKNREIAWLNKASIEFGEISQFIKI